MLKVVKRIRNSMPTSAFDDAAQPTGLALEMKARNRAWRWLNTSSARLRSRAATPARRPRLDPLAEGLRQHPRHAIAAMSRTGTAWLRRLAQRVDDALVDERNVDIGELGHDQERQRDDDATAKAHFALWPQMAPQNDQDRPGSR